MINKVLYSSHSDEWATPQYLFDMLNSKYRFTLDPCATVQNHKCDKYFTKDMDGLKQSWSGERVFCNPPYGRDIIKWVEKAFWEHVVNKILIVMLLPVRTDTVWFHEYIYGMADLYFIKGRLRFNDSINSAPFPSMIVVFKI